ncbi:MAG: DNA polymerase I [Paludibacteraceae bacterium]|nr:DNA polymerase I [Paludibacteraceae bacterium]
MRKLLLVDAYAMIFRAYYAFLRTPRMNSKGENTSAIFGFCITLDDLLRKVNPTHVAVAFDPHGPTFRHEAYEQYKAQREETPEDIRRAVPVIKQLLQAMNIAQLEVPGFEADDVIGTLAKQAEKADFDVFMATPDKDYGQLVSDRIRMYRPRHTGGFEIMGPQEVCAKYGLKNQEQVIDLLGLMGDASDNIPGCKGVGEKTAVALLQQFGTIDNMLEHTDWIKGALRQKVESQQEQIRFSRFLATIRTDVPISLDETQLLRKEPNAEELTRLYSELEFNTLLKKLAPSPLNPSVLADKPASQKAKPADSNQLDLFASAEDENEKIENCENEKIIHDSIEARLCQYLLNPEVAFNPHKEPDWDALKADTNLWNLYQNVELPLVPVLREMEEAGVRVDVGKLHEAEITLSGELHELEQHIYQVAGETFNVNSPRQVGELLFDKLKLDSKAKRSKTGQYATSEEILLAIRDRHEVVGLILNYRELKKLVSTYIATLPSYISPLDGKIHTTYNQTVTATGRLSSSNPNLQNLPIRSERGRFIREAVIPDPGCKFLSADYSQIELRLMAHFSQDEHLIAAFRNGQDIHAATAAKIFGIPIDQVTKDQRRQAKTANFGIIYGISAFGLAQQLDCSRTEAKQLIDDYFAAFPRVIEYIESQKELARQRGYAETLFGRKRYLPDINSHNATVRSFAERNAVNAPIQGTAADIIKMAMVSIHRRLKELKAEMSKCENDKMLKCENAQMIMQVHDELNFNVPEAQVERVREIVVSEMQNVVSLSVPLIAECGVGNNWLEAH